MKALVIIDMQNDFIDGALGTREAVEIADAVRAEIEQFKKSEILLLCGSNASKP